MSSYEYLLIAISFISGMWANSFFKNLFLAAMIKFVTIKDEKIGKDYRDQVSKTRSKFQERLDEAMELNKKARE